MRARTIGPDRDVDRRAHGRHDGWRIGLSSSAVPATPAPAEDVDVEALSNEEIDRLLDSQSGLDAGPRDRRNAVRCSNLIPRHVRGQTNAV